MVAITGVAAGRVLAAGGDEADAVALVLEQRAELMPAAVLAPVLRSRSTGQSEVVDKSGTVERDLVFCDEIGRPIYPETVSNWFIRHRKAAGVPTGSLHVLRHTSATLALTANPPVPLHVVAGRLGDDPTTLLATYAPLLPHSDEMAAETVAASIVDKQLTTASAAEAEPLSS